MSAGNGGLLMAPTIGARIQEASVVGLTEGGLVLDLGGMLSGLLPVGQIRARDRDDRCPAVFKVSEELDVTVVDAGREEAVPLLWPSEDPDIRGKNQEELQQFAKKSIVDRHVEALRREIAANEAEQGPLHEQEWGREQAKGPSRGASRTVKMTQTPKPKTKKQSERQVQLERIGQLHRENARKLQAARERLEKLTRR
jgi:hypothetical protein